MKHLFISLLAMLSGFYCSAQWTMVYGSAGIGLKDVDFISPDYGVVVGTNETILLTTNGGITWSDISNPPISGDVYSVTVKNTDTIYVSTYSYITQSGLIYKTENGGTTWNTIAADNAMAHKIDLALPVPSQLYAVGSSLVSTLNAGVSWDTLSSNVSGTAILDNLKFADPQTGHLSGIISGFTTYSAYFLRTEDSGANWYTGDVFSFPNADALTAMCFRNADTAYVFTNDYNGFVPSNTNGLIRICNFQLTSPAPGDTVFSFTSQIVNSAMPTLINDGIYLSADTGYAVGDNGIIYKTTDGGTTWSNDTTVGQLLTSIDFINGTGYVVGNSGTVFKYSVSSTGIPEANLEAGLDVHPFLANDVLIINPGDRDKIVFEIMSVKGDLIHKGVLHPDDNRIDVSGFAEGSYFVYVRIKTRSYAKKFAVSH